MFSLFILYTLYLQLCSHVTIAVGQKWSCKKSDSVYFHQWHMRLATTLHCWSSLYQSPLISASLRGWGVGRLYLNVDFICIFLITSETIILYVYWITDFFLYPLPNLIKCISLQKLLLLLYINPLPVFYVANILYQTAFVFKSYLWHLSSNESFNILCNKNYPFFSLWCIHTVSCLETFHLSDYKYIQQYFLLIFFIVLIFTFRL